MNDHSKFHQMRETLEQIKDLERPKPRTFNYAEGFRRMFVVWAYGWGVFLFFYSVAKLTEIMQTSTNAGQIGMGIHELAIVILTAVFWVILVPAIFGHVVKWIGQGFSCCCSRPVDRFVDSDQDCPRLQQRPGESGMAG